MSWRFPRTIIAIASVSGFLLGSVGAQAQESFLKDLGAVAPGMGINNNGEVVVE